MPAPSSSSVLPWDPFPPATGAEENAPEFTPPPGTKLASVRVSDGAADVAIAGPAPTEFRMPLTVEMRWTSRLFLDQQLVNFDFGCGVNWLSGLTPYLSRDGSAIGVGFTPDVAYWFNRVNGVYVGEFAAKQVLMHDDQSHLFTLAMPDGTLWKFLDLSHVGRRRGAFKSLTTPEGNTVEVTEYTASGHVAEIKWSYLDGGNGMAVTVTESIRIFYTPLTQDGTERVESIQWITRTGAGPETVVQEQRQTYYEPGDSHGNDGDLKTVSLVVPPVSGTPVVQHYMRYYTGSASGVGYQHGLQYQLGPDAVNELINDPQFTNFDAASESLIVGYADNYFEYAAEHRVTKSVVESGEYEFAVVESQFADGYNSWRSKTTVNQPDGVQRTRFSNHIQQMMLTNLGGARTCCRYNDGSAPNGKSCAALEVLLAAPEAVISYDENQANLNVQLKVNFGRIDEKSYYDDTQQAPGYVHQTWYRIGTGGPKQDIKTYHYGSKIVNGVTVYYVTGIT